MERSVGRNHAKLVLSEGGGMCFKIAVEANFGVLFSQSNCAHLRIIFQPWNQDTFCLSITNPSFLELGRSTVHDATSSPMPIQNPSNRLYPDSLVGEIGSGERNAVSLFEL